MPSQKYQNLHSHTTTSDGKLSYLQTLDVCKKNNISVVAFTDHDSLPDKKALKQLQKFSSQKQAVKYVMGIEISSGLPKELGGKPTSGFHILGLFIDPLNKALIEYTKKMQASRIERMERMVKNLQGLGFKITAKDCLEESKGEVVNRPHIVSALIKKPANVKIIQEIKNKLEKQGKKIFAKNISSYAYELFLENDAYIKNIYVDYLYGLELDKTVHLIRQAGGVAILAHWTFCKKRVSSKLVEKLLKEKRLDGVEIIFSFSKIDGREKEVLADMKKMKNLAKKYKALQSGGIDSHCEKDIIDFAKNKKFAEKTIGLYEKMTEQIKKNK